MSRGRRTLADYNPAIQAQILGALHPPKPSQPAQRPAPARAKAKAGAVIPPKRANAAKTSRPENQPSGYAVNFTEPSAYPFTIWLSYRVPSLNTIGGQWGKVAANRTAAKALSAVLPIMGNYPRQPAGVRLHLFYTSYVCQLRDADNPTTKFLNDQFRAVGLLRNDDPTCMALTVNPEVRVSKRALEGTRITFAEALV